MPRVLAVLAGGDVALGSLARWAASADVVVAADGGANRLVEAGHIPDAVVGDLDSLDPALNERLPCLVRVEDQDTTDGDKVLRYVAERGWDAVTIIGLEGDRLDHVLAGLGSAVACPLQVRYVLRTMVAHVLRPGAHAFPSTAGQLVSLMPCPSCLASLSGVRWPLDRAELRIGGPVSVSNRASGDAVTIRLDAGTAILFLERSADEAPDW